MSKTIIIGLLVLIAILLSIIIAVANKIDRTEVIEKKVSCSVYQEVYTESAKGCDKIAGCTCLHKNFFGYGTCDTCQCVRYITKCGE